MSKTADELSWLKTGGRGHRKKTGKPALGGALELLLSDNPDAVKVRQWIEKHPPVDADDPSRDSSLGTMLKALATIFSMSEDLTPWELQPAKDRSTYCDRVARLAGELAELLEKKPRPDSTMLEFEIDKQKGAMIVRSDRMPALLRNLAAHMHTVKESGSRDNRPNTPGRDEANARTFARDLSAYFEEFYERAPYEVIASCVALRFPGLSPPPNGDAIKNWLR